MNLMKQNLLPIGRNGEPGTDFIRCQGRRACSTCLFERKPVMVTLSRRNSVKKGKRPKRIHSFEGIPYLESLKRNAGVSDEAITCIRRLETVWKFSSNNRKAKGLLRLLKKEELWIAVYRKLSLNKEALRAGGGKGTIDGTSIKALRKLKNIVSSGNEPVAIIYKANLLKPKEYNPLDILKCQGKVIQEVLRILLECVYEPRFYENSHGFRPRRSQHTCLRQIRRDFEGAKWVIKGDVGKCFDTINHATYRKCLSLTIDDKPFVNLIIRGLRSKILVSSETLECTSSKTPLGTCNQLLSNIVLHQLDRFISRLKRRVNKGQQQKKYPEYVRLKNHWVMKTSKTAIDFKITPVSDSHHQGLDYARYTYDFIIGVNGPRELAVRVKMLITRFLKQRLFLELSEDQMVIAQISKNFVPFLGYCIRKRPSAVRKHTRGPANYTRTQPISPGRLVILVDVKKVVQSLAYKGFCSASEPIPNFRFMHQSQSYTIARANSILRGLNEYYRISENRKAAISYFSYLVRNSIAKMFAAKYKLGSVTHVFKKAGKALKNPLKSKTSSTGAVFKKNGQRVKSTESTKIKNVVNDTIPKLLYVKHADIQKPDLSPLVRKWNPWKRLEKKLFYNNMIYIEESGACCSKYS